MLWYKGWLETRFRMLFMIAFAVFPIALTLAASHPASPEPHSASYPWVDQAESAVGFFAMYYSIIPLFVSRIGNEDAIRPNEEGPPRLDVFHSFALARQPL